MRPPLPRSGAATSPHAAHEEGRLLAQPHPPSGTLQAFPGTHRLAIGGRRDGIWLVPANLDRSRPAPLIVAFHGAGGDAEQMIGFLQNAAERHGIVVLSPESRERTWDIIMGGYGPDLAFIDAALDVVFERVAIDPKRIAVSGFSDGGSYALSLGIINGTLFSDILAFSPGFMAPSDQDDHPRIFISHGSRDAVLPVEQCGRRLGRTLQGAGYDTDYQEFHGGHVVPDDMVERAITRFLGE
jgi:phospholipase/carboxylesterase